MGAFNCIPSSVEDDAPDRPVCAPFLPRITAGNLLCRLVAGPRQDSIEFRLRGAKWSAWVKLARAKEIRGQSENQEDSKCAEQRDRAVVSSEFHLRIAFTYSSASLMLLTP
jgi:hypothetical protein